MNRLIQDSRLLLSASGALVAAAIWLSPPVRAVNFDDRTPSVSELVSALSAGLSPAASDANESAPQSNLPAGVRTRGIKIVEPPAAAPVRVNTAATPVAPSAAGSGRVSMRIQFELNSDRILRVSADSLSNLAAALNSDQLRGQTFEVIGHTDMSGSAAHNFKLSERRARSVAHFLALVGVDPARAAAVGRGPTELLDGVPPDAAQHRRVEIRLGSAPQAVMTGGLAKSN